MSPASSTPSLSHWQTTRPSALARSKGTISEMGLDEMIMPPTWIDKCLGKSAISLLNVQKWPHAAESRYCPIWGRFSGLHGGGRAVGGGRTAILSR